MRNFRGTMLATALLLGLGGVAQAAPIFEVGNNPQPDEANVINNACPGGVDGPAALIKGCFNQAHDVLVDFTSNELIKYAAGGQAVIVAQDGAFTHLTISVEGHTFTDLILNINAVNDGTVRFTAFGSGGGVSGDLFLDGNGQNFFTILASAGTSFTSITLDTSLTGIELDALDNTSDVKQVRISGTGVPSDVPEPSTLALLGMGLVGVGALTRRRRDNDQALAA